MASAGGLRSVLTNVLSTGIRLLRRNAARDTGKPSTLEARRSTRQESIGEGLGRLYVVKHFPPEYKTRMRGLVQNLLTAYRQSIETLTWMGPEQKKEALAKLAKFTPKIGYPDKWITIVRCRSTRTTWLAT
jgi:predicted metalloendopeptidase